MGWSSTELKGVWVYEPEIFRDERGYFLETYNAGQLPDDLKGQLFVQDNEAKSSRGVIRGLHYQVPPFEQAKLVRCVSGEILDVIVDIRPDSETYGQHLAVLLNEDNKKQLDVPRGFAHGYAVLSATAIFAYKCDNYYAPKAEGGILYSDPHLNIAWKLEDHEIIVSKKDSHLPVLGQHIPFK